MREVFDHRPPTRTPGWVDSVRVRLSRPFRRTGTHTCDLSRIERDLHDGPQAQLVALAMTIGLAEQLLRERPEAAMELLAEARKTSTQVLAELRDLVHGSLPILAERGLEGAIRSLGHAQPIPVDMEIELPGPLEARVESAAYFAMAEALANVLKHSHATRAWLHLHHGEGRLHMLVGDNGIGGAALTRGTGLRGVEHRLAALGGTLTLHSPRGGPTLVTMTLGHVGP